MAKTRYNFPTQTINAGAVDVTIYTSGGAGGTVTVSEKYFSSIRITEDTEERGGQIRSYSADITLEDDYNNLFTGTFFPYLYQQGGYVHVIISVGGDIRFYGSVIPNSINLTTYYATDDALSNRKNSITFKCGWILDLLKGVQMDAVYQSVIDNNLYETVTGSFGVTTLFAKLTDIFGAAVGLLNTTYGLNVVMFIQANNDLFEFKSADADGNTYTFAYEGPASPSSTGYSIPNGSISGTNGVGLVIQSASQVSGYFDPTSDRYIGSAYDFIVGVFKSFQLYPIVAYDSFNIFDLIVTVAPRTSGSQRVLNNIISHEESLFNILSSDKITVTSQVSGNEYEKINNIYGSQSFSDSTLFDFHNDNDFPGTAFTEPNNIYSLMLQGTFNGSYKYIALVRYCVVGQTYLTNGDFAGNLTGWDVGSSSFVYGSSGFDTYAETDKFGSNEILIQTLSDDLDLENYLIGLRIYTSVPSAQSGLTIRLYNDSQILASKVTSLPYSGWNNYWLNYDGKIPVNKILIATPYLGVGTLSATVRVANVFLKRNRNGCPEIEGKVVKDYFNNALLTIKKIRLDGVTKYPIADYVTIDAENYYIKSADYDLNENATELEVINYPY